MNWKNYGWLLLFMTIPAVIALFIGFGLGLEETRQSEVRIRWSNGGLQVAGPTPFTLTHLVHYTSRGISFAQLKSPLTAFDSDGLNISSNQLVNLQWSSQLNEPRPAPAEGDELGAYYVLPEKSLTTRKEANRAR